jgi:hypothetical protein
VCENLCVVLAPEFVVTQAHWVVVFAIDGLAVVPRVSLPVDMSGFFVLGLFFGFLLPQHGPAAAGADLCLRRSL